MTEKEKRILAMQAPSTRRALERPESEDLAWFKREVPKSAVAVPNARTEEERVGARALSYQEVKIEEGLRYNRGAILAMMRKEADPSSVDEAKRDRAIDAFMFIKVKFKDLMKMAGLATDQEMMMVKDEK